jgi:hypothetical protein
VWEPLLAIADAAGKHWPQTARRSAVALVAAAQANGGASSLGVRLLRDLRGVFTQSGQTKLATDTILEALCALEDAPWGDLRRKAPDSRNLSRRLDRYGVKPKQIRFGDRNVRGYDSADLADPWRRYVAGAAAPTTKSDPTHPEALLWGDDVTPPLASAAATPATPLHADDGCRVCGHPLPVGLPGDTHVSCEGDA